MCDKLIDFLLHFQQIHFPVLYYRQYDGGDLMKYKDDDLYNVALQKCQIKNVGDLMCQRLVDLNGKSAEEILKSSGQTDVIPVNLEKIITTINVYKHPRTFDDIEKIEGRDVAGLVLLNNDDIGIFYDSEVSLAQKRFIIAHEIGHCCLHGDTLKDGYIEFLHNDGYENQHEIEASAFASRLLIPEQSLIAVYNKLILPSINGLCDIFEVPSHLMKFRLENLKMKYYIDEKDLVIEPK